MDHVGLELWRGRRPYDIRQLIQLNFKRIIVLQSGAEDMLTDSLYEAQLRAKRADRNLYSEIEVIYIPCSNVLPPDEDQVEKFLDVANSVPQVPTFMHCHSGVDRTGFMAAVFEMQTLGRGYKEVKDRWVKLGRHWWFAWWVLALKTWEPK